VFITGVNGTCFPSSKKGRVSELVVKGVSFVEIVCERSRERNLDWPC
jgi:hypothetical protein